jgi:hypothetical protein
VIEQIQLIIVITVAHLWHSQWTKKRDTISRVLGYPSRCLRSLPNKLQTNISVACAVTLSSLRTKQWRYSRQTAFGNNKHLIFLNFLKAKNTLTRFRSTGDEVSIDLSLKMARMCSESGNPRTFTKCQGWKRLWREAARCLRWWISSVADELVCNAHYTTLHV